MTLRPLTDDFPAVTEHERIGAEILTLIPPEAPVATSSGINPHLSQRRQIGLFPEFDQADYVALDVTADPYPIDAPSQWWRVQELLAGGQWGVLAARDGFLILERGGARRDLPSEFFTFTRVDPPQIGQPRTVIFDQAVEFLGFDLKPGPTVHGRDPRARLALYFRPLQPLRDDYRVNVSVTDPAGALSGELLYHPATTWLPTSRWEPGATYRIDVPGVSPYGLPEALVWLAFERGSPDQPARAPLQAEPTATIDPARQAVFLTPLRSG